MTTNFTTNQYIRQIVTRYTPQIFKRRTILRTYNLLSNLLRRWASGYLFEICPSGSYAKGTSLTVGTDLDIYVCLRNVDMSLGDIFQHLQTYLTNSGIRDIRRQNVSLGFYLNGHKNDVTPARKQKGLTNDASIYLSKSNSWTQTNVRKHITYVKESNRITEIKAIKIWKYLNNIDISSFYLELIAIEALKNRRLAFLPIQGYLSRNIVTVLEYIRDELEDAYILDPANSGNVITDDITSDCKRQLSQVAGVALSGDWRNFIY